MCMCVRVYLLQRGCPVTLQVLGGDSQGEERGGVGDTTSSEEQRISPPSKSISTPKNFSNPTAIAAQTIGADGSRYSALPTTLNIVLISRFFEDSPGIDDAF